MWPAPGCLCPLLLRLVSLLRGVLLSYQSRVPGGLCLGERSPRGPRIYEEELLSFRPASRHDALHD